MVTEVVPMSPRSSQIHIHSRVLAYPSPTVLTLPSTPSPPPSRSKKLTVHFQNIGCPLRCVLMSDAERMQWNRMETWPSRGPSSMRSMYEWYADLSITRARSCLVLVPRLDTTTQRLCPRLINLSISGDMGYVGVLTRATVAKLEPYPSCL